MQPPPSNRTQNNPLWREIACLTGVIGLTVAFLLIATDRAFTRYDSLCSGWSWDLAYYNQWFWDLTHGFRLISVRPQGPWTIEGPWIWVMNYLAPIRLLIAPIYALVPGPKTLLAVQCATCSLVIPAAYAMIRSESGSPVAALLGAILVPFFPLIWPLTENDFRELQMAIPFVVIAVDGVRGRRIPLATLGIAGTIACRHEYAILVATLAFLPPRRPEDASTRLRWSTALWTIGLAWFLFAFLGYIRWFVSENAWGSTTRLAQSQVSVATRLTSSARAIVLGCGGWALLAAFAPRVGLLALPWLWQACGGLFGMQQLDGASWHHVRYFSPFVGLTLAAGCVGYGMLARRILEGSFGRLKLVLLWLGIAVGSTPAALAVYWDSQNVPDPVSSLEAVELWKWINQVGPEEGVLAHYDLCAPLSSRQCLFSYILRKNEPPGYPQMDPQIRWGFVRRGDVAAVHLLQQGFETVHAGQKFQVLRRRGPLVAANPNALLEPILYTVPALDRSWTNRWLGFSWSEFRDDPVPRIMYYAIRVGVMVGLLLPTLAIDFGLRRRWRRISLAYGQASIDLDAFNPRKLVGRLAPPSTRVLPTSTAPTDVYDPATQTIRLSQPTSEADSTLALAVTIRESFWANCSGPSRVLPHLRLALLACWRMGNRLGWLLIAAGPILWIWSPTQLGAWVLLLTRAILLPIRFGVEGWGSMHCVERLKDQTLDMGQDRQTLIHLISSLVFTLPFLDLHQPLHPASKTTHAPHLPPKSGSAD